MTAGILNIKIEQGADFVKRLTWNDSSGSPIDLTNCTARMMVKKSFKDTTPLVSLTTENQRITLGGAAGTIDLFIPAAITATVKDSGIYDLEVVSETNVTRIVQGTATLMPEVTR